MSSATYQLPAVLKKALSLLPAYPGSMLFAGALNAVLVRHLPADTLDRLDGRALRIEARDAGIAFDFVCRGGRFSAVRPQSEVALTISASTHDFMLLAQRKEDPDTLFFSRRLTMEGDTELGLLVKNALDATDLATYFSLGRFAPERWLRRVREMKGPWM
ncbi:MAG TPA: SCP2 sterol-binding domain-containing protein [Paraburkholderia sp.]|jgi:predicted lipid carrier protein YhbT|uniref:ubiquinone anaerobic biosynthesis accessory factor UbiT n=1 Tax=Paraburkholderia sp. TaxID=1926495 RepID=UPI002B47AB27|nr:SCP2 sterol-binding domain-containing protein [Paraburkholderia sp.]HKR44690.1 SCP2 sterol-binding domain-containing protein [Paraburkholderia sp.]